MEEQPAIATTENETDGARKRVATEKGREYKKEKLKNDRKLCLANVNKQMKKIQPLLTNFVNEKLVRLEVNEFDGLFIIFQECSEHFINELDDEIERKEAIEWFNKHDKEVFDFKQKIINYLQEAKLTKMAELDQKSLKSKHSKSKHSSLSSSSSKSSRVYLMKARARASALEIEQTFLRESQELKNKQEELELKQKLAQARAEEVIFENFENETEDVLVNQPAPSSVKYISTPTFANPMANIATYKALTSVNQSTISVLTNSARTPLVSPIVAPPCQFSGKKVPKGYHVQSVLI